MEITKVVDAGVTIYPTEEVVWLDTVQTGVLVNALPKVTVQVEDALLPVVTRPKLVPTIVGEVPQLETLETVPVALRLLIRFVRVSPVIVVEPVRVSLRVVKPVTPRVEATAKVDLKSVVP